MTQTIIAWFHTPGGILIVLFALILTAIIWLIASAQEDNKTW